MNSSTQISPPLRLFHLFLPTPHSPPPYQRRDDAVAQVRKLTHLSLCICLCASTVCLTCLSVIFELQMQPTLRPRPLFNLSLPPRSRIPATAMMSLILMSHCPHPCPPARLPLPSLRRNDTVSKNRSHQSADQ